MRICRKNGLLKGKYHEKEKLERKNAISDG